MHHFWVCPRKEFWLLPPPPPSKKMYKIQIGYWKVMWTGSLKANHADQYWVFHNPWPGGGSKIPFQENPYFLDYWFKILPSFIGFLIALNSGVNILQKFQTFRLGKNAVSGAFKSVYSYYYIIQIRFPLGNMEVGLWMYCISTSKRKLFIHVRKDITSDNMGRGRQ